MCTAQVQEAKYSMDERARQYKSEKFDKMSRDAQEKIGEQSGALYRTVEQVPNALKKFGDEVSDFMNPKQAPGSEQSDTVSANYSKSSSEKSSKTDKKGKTESKGGTGGSKRQFYA